MTSRLHSFNMTKASHALNHSTRDRTNKNNHSLSQGMQWGAGGDATLSFLQHTTTLETQLSRRNLGLSHVGPILPQIVLRCTRSLLLDCSFSLSPSVSSGEATFANRSSGRSILRSSQPVSSHLNGSQARLFIASRKGWSRKATEMDHDVKSK